MDKKKEKEPSDKQKNNNHFINDVSNILYHVCGLQGYNPMIDGSCPKCKKIFNSD